jgi:hypothetical protein
VTVADAEHALKSKLGTTRDRSGDHVYFYFRDGESEYAVGKLSHSWKGQLTLNGESYRPGSHAGPLRSR